MPSSTLAAKQIDVRASDFASSNSVVALKTYDSSTSYNFYLPSKDPKYLDGVSGDEQVADQVLAYDVLTDKYVWKQAASTELFIQGTTTSIGSDERGNVLTVGSEKMVQPGDPMYDPDKPLDEQVYRVVQEFTDSLHNMNQIASGKKSGVVTYDKTTGLYFDFTDSSVNPGGSTDAQKQAKDQLTLTTKKLQSGSEFSQVVLKPTSADVVYENTSSKKTKLSLADDDLKMFSQDKTVLTSQLIKTVSTCYPGLVSTTATTFTQMPSELKYDFGSDSSFFKVDNATKKVETDMSCIEFGDASNKHRLKIFDNKLFFQKYNTAASKWIGAQIVIDETLSFTATLTIDSATVTGLDCAVAVTLGGTGYDHWHVMTDDDVSGMIHVASGTFTHTFTGMYTGDHKIVAWPVDASHVQVGEKQTHAFTISETPPAAPAAAVNTATVTATTSVTDNDATITVTEAGTGSTGYKTFIDDDTSTTVTKATGEDYTFTLLTHGVHTITIWPVDGSGDSVGPKITVEVYVTAASP